MGAQFDTVYREGVYELKRGRDPFGGRGGGRPESCQGSAACPEDWQAKAEALMSVL